MVLSPQIQVSVALVTRNRPSSLEMALKSWRAQTVQPFEIIVSDDSDSLSAELVKDLSVKYGCHYVRGPQQGLYSNRNHAALHCTGTHMLTADDDHEHPPNYLSLIASAASTEESTVWSMGELYSWDEFRSNQPWFGPGEIQPSGALGPVKDEPCWAISDGATLYPLAIFRSGLRFYDKIKFGDSYKEFGCLLHHFGWNIRPLRTTGVIHHLQIVGRSFNNIIEQNAATCFAMLMFSFCYQPNLGNQIRTLTAFAKNVLIDPTNQVKALRLALHHFQARKAQLCLWSNLHRQT